MGVYSLLPGFIQQVDGIKLMPEEDQWGQRKGENKKEQKERRQEELLYR